MRELASESLSSTEMNTPSKEGEFSPSDVGVDNCNEYDFSEQSTPRTVNTFQDCCAVERTTSEESFDRLRISVLYLEGISSSSIPSSRVSVWVGFRSSFPSDSMSVTSSNYSSHFLREGNLLAVESDLVKWTPADDEDADCTSSFSGIAFWDSASTDKIETPHLEVAMALQTRGEHSHNPDNIELPDILEFHICIIHERSPPNENVDSKSQKIKKASSNLSLNQWDNEMEEVHWYNDDEGQGSDSDRDSGIQFPLEQEVHHGVAHLKVHKDQFGSKRKMVHLPVRMKQAYEPVSCVESGQAQHIFLSEQEAILTIQVEETHLPIEPIEQRHYAKNMWSNGCECAPPSVKCCDDNSLERETKSTSLAKHFRFDTIKSIINRQKSADEIISNSNSGEERSKQSQNVIITDDALQITHKDGMNKIHKALESSFKSMNDSKKLAAAMKQQRENQPKELEHDLYPTKISPINQPQEIDLYQCLDKSLNDTDNKIVHSKSPTLCIGKSKLQDTQQKRKDMPEGQSDQITRPQNNSILSRLLCGADFTDVMLHCDEDHAGMYVDSMSLSSINT